MTLGPRRCGFAPASSPMRGDAAASPTAASAMWRPASPIGRQPRGGGQPLAPDARDRGAARPLSRRGPARRRLVVEILPARPWRGRYLSPPRPDHGVGHRGRPCRARGSRRGGVVDPDGPAAALRQDGGGRYPQAATSSPSGARQRSRQGLAKALKWRSSGGPGHSLVTLSVNGSRNGDRPSGVRLRTPFSTTADRSIDDGIVVPDFYFAAGMALAAPSAGHCSAPAAQERLPWSRQPPRHASAPYDDRRGWERRSLSTGRPRPAIGRTSRPRPRRASSATASRRRLPPKLRPPEPTSRQLRPRRSRPAPPGAPTRGRHAAMTVRRRRYDRPYDRIRRRPRRAAYNDPPAATPPRRLRAARATAPSRCARSADAGHGFFGSISQGLASVIEYAFKSQGRPNGYILGEDVGGAFVAGLRYGEGMLTPRMPAATRSTGRAPRSATMPAPKAPRSWCWSTTCAIRTRSMSASAALPARPTSSAASA